MKQAVQVGNCVIEKEMCYKDTSVLYFKISYPQFCSPNPCDSINRINRFYKDKAIAFQRYCETKLYCTAVKEYKYSVANGFPVRAFEAQVDYTVTYNEDVIISLYSDEYQFTGGAHGNTVRRSQTWNTQSGCRISLCQIFHCDVDYRAYLIQEINRQIAAQIENGQNYYFEDYEKLVAETFRADQFFLTPEGIAIYFQQYDIAPYSSGLPVFIIPYTEVSAACAKNNSR